MGKVKSISIVDKIMAEVLDETRNYNEAIKNGRPLSEAKEIRAKIKTLVNELAKLLSKTEN